MKYIDKITEIYVEMDDFCMIKANVNDRIPLKSGDLLKEVWVVRRFVAPTFQYPMPYIHCCGLVLFSSSSFL